MSAFNPRQMWVLDEACKPIRDGFGDTPYLVGTAVERKEYRDVDVRLILKDKKFRRLKAAIGLDGIALLGLLIGEHLAARTGMPIDFQIQEQTAANHHHGNKMRNPLGLRELINYRGDAPLLEPKEDSDA